MAQYDLVLTQNVASSGAEFSERLVTMAKGTLISANSSNVPTALAAGTNGYFLTRDDAEVTGLKWVAAGPNYWQRNVTVLSPATTGDTLAIDSVTVPVTTGKYVFGDGDSYFFESTDDQIMVYLAAANRWRFTTGQFRMDSNGGPAMQAESSTSTNPVFCPINSDAATGIGGTTSQVSVIVSSTEILQVAATVVTVNAAVTVTATTKAAGYLYGGTTYPTNATRLNYDGYFYATRLYSTHWANDQSGTFTLYTPSLTTEVLTVDSSASNIGLEIKSKGTGGCGIYGYYSGGNWSYVLIDATNKIYLFNTSGDYYLGSASYPVDSGTTANVLYYDTASGKVTHGAVSGGVSLSGSTDNTICTVTGANAIQGESNLRFDGTTLNVGVSATGNITIGALSTYGGKITLANATNDAIAYIEMKSTAVSFTSTYNATAGFKPFVFDFAGETALQMNANGSVDLYYDNSKKFETTSTGANAYGFLRTIGNHGTTRVVLASDDATDCLFTLGAGSPNIAYTQAWIGNNIDVDGPYYGRADTGSAASLIELNLGTLNLAVYNSSGTKYDGLSINAGYNASAQHFYPNGNNTYYLGYSNLRWSTIYGVNANLTGALTIDTARPVVLQNGQISIKGETGSNALMTRFYGSSNSVMGEFGALTNSDSLQYLYIGTYATDPWTNYTIRFSAWTNSDLIYINSGHSYGGYVVFSTSGTAKGFIGSRYQLENSTLGYENDISLRSNANLSLLVGGGYRALLAIDDGAVELYYNAVKKFETYTSGAKTTGSHHIKGYGSLLYFDTDGAEDSAWIRAVSQYNIEIYNSRGTTSKIILSNSGQVELYHGTGKKFETQSGGSRAYTALGVNADASGTYALNVGGHIYSSDNMYADDFVQTSDARWKTDIKVYQPKYLDIEYKQFRMRDDETKQLRFGVVAQDIQEKHPEFVRTLEGGKLAVSYNDLWAAEIAYLKSKVSDLENKLSKYEN